MVPSAWLIKVAAITLLTSAFVSGCSGDESSAPEPAEKVEKAENALEKVPPMPERVPLVNDPAYVDAVMKCYRLDTDFGQFDFDTSNPASEECDKIAEISTERCLAGESVYCSEADSHLNSLNYEDSVKLIRVACVLLNVREHAAVRQVIVISLNAVGRLQEKVGAMV